MTHPMSSAIDTVCWVLVALILGFYGFRGFAASDDKPTVIRRSICSAGLGFLIVAIYRTHNPVLYLLSIIPMVIIGFLWLPGIVTKFMRPLTGAFEGDPEEAEAKPFYFLAEGMRRKGQYQAAISEIRKQLEQFPGNYEGYLKLASIQMENLNDLRAAEATLNEFLALPNRAVNETVAVLHLLADWQLQYAHDARAAANYLRRVVQLFPNSALAQAAEQRIAHLATADEAHRAHHEKKFMVTQGERDVGLRAAAVSAPAPEDPQIQVEECVRQLEAHPADNEARERLAVLYAEKFQRLDLATDQLEQMIGLPSEAPRHVAHWLNLLATLQVKYAHDQQAAERALRRITDLFPGSALATMAIERLATLQGELKAVQPPPAKALGNYEKNLGLKRPA